MSQERVPEAPNQAMGTQRWRDTWRLRPSLLVAAVVVLSLVASSLLAWPWSRTPTPTRAAVAPVVVTVTLDSTSGPPGTVVTVSAAGFPVGYADQSSLAQIAFDGAPVGTARYRLCGVAGTATSAGFGPACATTLLGFSYTIPITATNGVHTFTVSDAIGRYSGQASFTVAAPTSTPTGTPTGTPTPTATSPTFTATPTATASATATPVAPTATTAATGVPTSTAAPSATSTSTPQPSAPSATPTPTAAPKVGVPFVALVRPQFDHDLLAIALHAVPGARIHIELGITVRMVDGSVKPVFNAKRDGMADARGRYALNLKLSVPAHGSGTASLTISETSGGATHTVKRTYRYRMYG